MIILLAPEKIITSTAKEQWAILQSQDVVLFTSKSQGYIDFLDDWKNTIFKDILFFDNYPSNDAIEFKLMEYAKKNDIKNIIPMTEADILRVSVIKEKLGMNGLSYDDAIFFRDKIAMKELAIFNEIDVPQFKRIKNTIDLIEFIDNVGYPIIIKPILGRGSFNTLFISNEHELLNLLNTGLISDTSRYPDLLAEKYLQAEIYHIDGLQLNNHIQVISVSKYINNCLSFVNGSYLGSYTLNVNNPLRQKIVQFSNKVLTGYPLDKNALFHIEVFVDSNQKISLCEIACRIGGNGINDEVKLQQDIDIKIEFIKAECEITNLKPPQLNDAIAGRLLIPPKEGKLISFPETCDIQGVVKYQFRGKKGKDYKKMLMSNDEIANFLLVAKTENEMYEKITQLTHWFDERIVWDK